MLGLPHNNKCITTLRLSLLLLRCIVLTHAGTVVKNIRNQIEMHYEKRRGLGIEDVAKETFIDWNGSLFISGWPWDEVNK